MSSSTEVSRLQQTYPLFEYVSFAVQKHEKSIQFRYEFRVGSIMFHPEVSFQTAEKYDFLSMDDEQLRILAFHIGLSEIPSYWKAMCSQTIQIHAGVLSNAQIAFWQKLFLNGMGEFFTVNQIVPFSPAIVCNGETKQFNGQWEKPIETTPSIIIPVGGGKDSVVSLELLKSYPGAVSTLVIGHDQASQNVIARYKEERKLAYQIQVERTLDPQLFELNTHGFLNGHTPFSSVAAFLTVAAGIIFKQHWIAVSNERSANEPSTTYQGMPINHQYSKSYEFEHDFRSYCAIAFGSATEYFSLLRPLYEIQVAKLFAGLPNYHHLFRSCNVGQKQNVWCGNCPKCLFVALMLSAFMDAKNVKDIFGSDVLSNEQLASDLQNMVSEHAGKPFECIGTREESQVAIYLVIKKYEERGEPVPALLLPFVDKAHRESAEHERRAQLLLNSWNTQHHLPSQLEDMIHHV